MKASLRLRQPAIPLLTACLLVLQLMDPSPAWKILFVSLGGVWLAAYLWARLLGGNLRLRRETRLGWVQVGGQVEERFTLSNSSVIPAAWVEVIDQSTLPDHHASRVTSVSGGYFDQWSAVSVCRRRGLFTLGGAELRTGDPFGIYEVTIHDSKQTSLLVLPQLVDLPSMQIAPAGFQGDGRPRPNALEQTISAGAVREYRPGDGLRLIHWPTSARMQELYVRLVESAPEGNWWILLDLDYRLMLGEGWDSIEEQSVSLAASLAGSGLLRRKSVGLISSGKNLAWLPPDVGEGHRFEILQALAQAKPGPLDLASLLDRIHPALGRHHSLLVVTASTKLDWLKTLLPLARRGVTPTVFLFDPKSFGGGESADAPAAVIQQWGIACHVIPHGILRLPEARFDHPTERTWRYTPTGALIPILVSNGTKRRGAEG